MIRPPIANSGIILPLKNPSLLVLPQVIRRIANLPISSEAKIVIDGSDPKISEKVWTLVSKYDLNYLHITGNKHVAIDRGIKELLEQSRIDAAIILDDDSLIDARWVTRATRLLSQHDIVWGFGVCKDPGVIAGFVNIDLNIMVALLDREYWLESGVYAFRLDAYHDVEGFGERGINTLSDDHALMIRFSQKSRTLEVNPALHHRLLNHRGLLAWFKQKIRWMGEILLISHRNVFLSLLSIPLALTSPLLMWKAARITRLSFPRRSFFTAPFVFAAYTLAMLIAYRRIARGRGIKWQGQIYHYNLPKE